MVSVPHFGHFITLVLTLSFNTEEILKPASPRTTPHSQLQASALSVPSRKDRVGFIQRFRFKFRERLVLIIRFLSTLLEPQERCGFFAQRFLIYETQKPLAVGRIQPE
jgi:hypothetical protein